MKRRALHDWILATDLFWLPVALIGAETLARWPGHAQAMTGSTFSSLAASLIPAWLIWALLSRATALDGFRKGWRFPAVISRLLLTISFLVGSVIAISYVTKQALVLRAAFYFELLLLIGYCGIRLAARNLIRKQNSEASRVVILGSGNGARRLAAKLRDHPELFCKVVGLICPEPDLSETSMELGTSSLPPSVPTVEVAGLLQQQQVNELIVLHSANSAEVANLATRCRASGIRVSLVPHPYEPYLSRLNLLDLNGVPLLRAHNVVPSPFTRMGKRAMDLILGSVLAALTLPIVLLCALVLRWTTGRSFRWETRIGWHGREFSMLRLNIERDPQNVSFFQWLLWHLSVSELPQLWNVFCGEMSLVGPRPEGPERTRHYSPWQEQRLSARPGITGLAQVQGLREQSASEEKTEFDLQYLARPSLFSDLSLLLETVWAVAMRLSRFPRLLFADRSIRRTSVSPELDSFDVYPIEEEMRAHRAQSGSD